MYYYVYTMFYFSSQQDILGTIMYITCFISVVNGTYYVLLCIYHVLYQQSIGHTRYYYVYNMFYFSSQQDILGTIMYIKCSFQQTIGHTRYYYVYNMLYFNSQWDILCTIIYITCFISVVNRTYQVLCMYITCFISVVNRTYQVLLCIYHVLLQQSMGYTMYYYVYNTFYISSQQDILGTNMHITRFISVVNRTYQVLLCI